MTYQPHGLVGRVDPYDRPNIDLTFDLILTIILIFFSQLN